MKTPNKLISILLSILMLMQLTTSIVFAEAGLPASSGWDSSKAGYINFTTVSGITEYNYILYKDGNRIMRASVDTDESESGEVSDDIRVRLLKNGAGTYSFKFVTYDEDEEITSEGTTYSYTYSPVSNPGKPATPQNPGFANSKITWTQDTTGVDGYTANFYAVTADRNYKLTENVYFGSTPSIDIYDYIYNVYNEEIERSGLDASTTSLVAEISAIPTDIINYTLSDYSNTVVISGNAQSGPAISGVQTVASGSCGESASWKLTSDGTLTISGTGSVTDASGYTEYKTDITKLVISSGIEKIDNNMFYEFYNIKEVSIANTVTSIGEGFLKGSAVSVVKLPESVTYVGEWFCTKCENLTKLYVYNPYCTFEYDIYAPMSSSATVYGYFGTDIYMYADANGNTFVSIDPDYTVNGTSEEPVEVNSPSVTIVFNDYAINNFSQYKILDGEYKNTSDIKNATITYELDTKDGEQAINIEFKNDKLTLSVYKTIILNNKHTVTYKANNETFKVVTVGCGHEIPEMTEVPDIDGYRFDGWEEIPEIMPDEDIVINAKLTKISTVSGIVKYNDAPLQGAEIIIDDAVKATTAEDGSFSFTIPSGEYMATVKSGDMTKAIAIDATGKTAALGKIVLSAVSSNVNITEETVTLVEGIDALITEEDTAYTETPGNTVTVSVSIAPAASNTDITEAIASKYVQYTSGIMLDIDINKTKTGTESSVTPVTETSSLISVKFEIPEAFRGKDVYVVLREHDGKVDALTEAANDNGEYITIDGNYITIHAKKFSTYALIGKTVSYVSSSGGGGSSKCTVKFETNGGSKVNTKSVARNKTVAEPEAPVKDGFVFGGWYTDEALTSAYDFSAKVTKSFTLYAKWVENGEEKADEENKAEEITIILTIGEADALINGETVTNDVAPKIVNERTMLPIRFIAEKLGAKVGWDGETETVTVTFEDKDIIIVIGESSAAVNGEKIELDSPAFVENDRTYLPIRFVMENLGADVQWDEENQRVTIIK